jgi:hypothetical protein
VNKPVEDSIVIALRVNGMARRVAFDPRGRLSDLLRDSLAALFEEQADPIEVIKWKEIYETMETVTDRCEDVVNVIEGIILKMA